MNNKNLNLTATIDKTHAYKNSQFVIIATPTNYDEKQNYFDTSTVDSVVNDDLTLNSEALIIIKSTIPIGHTKYLQEKLATDRVIFSPEFLREGSALKDNLWPARIVVGSENECSLDFAKLLQQSADKKDIETIIKEIKNNFKYLKLKSANIEKNKSIYVFWYDIEEKKSEDFLSNIKKICDENLEISIYSKTDAYE